VLIDQ